MQLNDKNYFQIFSLPETFALDVNQLNSAYRKLQDEVHPDRFANGTEAERLQAVQAASLLNQAFSTLDSSLLRAQYLLQLRGIDTERVDQSNLSPALLMEQIQWRESLEELPRDDSALPQLDALRCEVEDKLATEELEFAATIKAADLQQAQQHFHAMQYMHKLRREIESVEEELLGY